MDASSRTALRRFAGKGEDQIRGDRVPNEGRRVPVRHIDQAPEAETDNSIVREVIPITDRRKAPAATPWTMRMRAISLAEPSRLVQTLTGAILGCGGWILSRTANDSGGVNLLFEFERQVCVDIYTILIASGLELSQSGHLRLTELCQCTRLHAVECGGQIASIDLEIQTYPLEMATSSQVSGLE